MMLLINHESHDATLGGDNEQAGQGPVINFQVCQLETYTTLQCVTSYEGYSSSFPKTIDTNKAPGPDRIHPRILKVGERGGVIRTTV